MTDVNQVAMEIAKKLSLINDAEREKVVAQNQLDNLLEQVDAAKERLNRLDATITSTKFEITHRINEAVSNNSNPLSVVK